MTITYLPGKKGPKDVKVLWNGIQVEMPDIAEICVALYKNEEYLFPQDRCYDCKFKSEPCKTHTRKQFEGGEYNLKFIKDCCDAGEVTDGLLRKYRLGKYRPKSTDLKGKDV